MMTTRIGFLVGIGALLSGASAGAATSKPAAMPAPRNRLVGRVVSISGNTLILQRRNGQQITIDLTQAYANGHVGVLEPNLVVEVRGIRNADGSFTALSTGHSSDVIRAWEPDN